jgi:hypothetical protein
MIDMLKTLLAIVLIISASFAITSSFATPPPTAGDQESGHHCWLYTGKYHNYRTTEEGCTTLPRTVFWQVDDTTGYPDRITIRLRDGNFLPLVAQMDLETAKRLHAELGKKVAEYESNR